MYVLCIIVLVPITFPSFHRRKNDKTNGTARTIGVGIINAGADDNEAEYATKRIFFFTGSSPSNDILLLLLV